MRAILLCCGMLVLSACSASSREKIAADACVAEINSRLSGKTFMVDAQKLTESAKESAKDTLQLAAPIVFNRRTNEEYTQTVDCRVRLDAAAPSVIFLQFNWSMEDLKKAGTPAQG